MDTLRRTPSGPTVGEGRPTVTPTVAANRILDTMYRQSKPWPHVHDSVCAMLVATASWSHVYVYELDELAEAIEQAEAADRFSAIMS